MSKISLSHYEETGILMLSVYLWHMTCLLLLLVFFYNGSEFHAPASSGSPSMSTS